MAVLVGPDEANLSGHFAIKRHGVLYSWGPAMTNQPDTMSLERAVYGRRSVRTYAPGRIDDDVLSFLLDAAVQAPTAIHQEPWRFVIVQSEHRLKQLSERAKELFAPEVERLHHAHGQAGDNPFAQPEFDVFYGAGTLIVICAPSAAPFAEADCWLAAQNLMLTAYAMGLGTCVIGSAAQALNEPSFKDSLGIPTEYTAIAPLIVGFPKGETAPQTRHRPAILSRW
ncbi:MAG: nitroreductase family protein [Burkholderiales bacterium]|nr:nitroreductase family protein [Burkholderiales bacterium]